LEILSKFQLYIKPRRRLNYAKQSKKLDTSKLKNSQVHEHLTDLDEQLKT
jgi:hypothetical protein